MFTLTAHTGCIKTKENSLESIEAGIKNGADIVEFDLSFLGENPVLSHDKPEGGEVTLEDAFKKVSEYEHIKVNVDVKETAYLEKVLPLAQKYGIENRIFFTGIKDEFVSEARKTGVEYYLNVNVEKKRNQTDEYLTALVEKVKNSGAIGINFNKDNATKRLVDIFHENNLLVSIWTVDRKHKMKKIIAMNPDNITTRKLFSCK